jgi:hypothetical protein
MKGLHMEEYLYKNLTYKIIGVCMEVHKELGCGFLEALEKEFKLQNIPYVVKLD